MAHPTLLHAVCAYTVYCNLEPFEGHRVCDHMQRACSVLKNRLEDPSIIDEGDLFAVALLAMCSVSEEDTFLVHVDGFSAVAGFLFERAKGNLTSYSLASFWAMARDEIIRHAWDWNSEKSRESKILCGLIEVFRKVTGHSIFEKRIEYEKELEGDHTCTHVVSSFTTTWQQFVFLENQVRSKAVVVALANLESEAQFMATLPNIFVHLYGGLDENELLRYIYIKLREAAQLGAEGKSEGTTKREARRAAACLFLRQLCRMFLVLLEAPSPEEGACSPAFVEAVKPLFSLFHSFQTVVNQVESSSCKCNIFNTEKPNQTYATSKCRLHMRRCPHGKAISAIPC